MSMTITAYFSEAGVPKTGLSPTVDLYDVSDNSLDIDNGALTEIAVGFYKYTFAGHDPTKDYVFLVDGTVTLADTERYAAGSIPENKDASIDAVLVDTGTTLPATLATILADTNEIQVDTNAVLVDTGTTLPATLASILEDTGTTLPATLAAILLDTGTTLPATLVSILSDTNAVLVDTGTTLPATLAAILLDTGTTLSATLASILSDTNAVLVDTGTTLPATLATILADTNEIQIDLTNGGRLDTLIDAIKIKTDNLPPGIPKNVALNNFTLLMIDSADHVSPKTGLTVTALISQDGAAFGSCTNSVLEISNGLYKINLTQAEMNADIISLVFTASGANQTTITLKTSS